MASLEILRLLNDFNPWWRQAYFPPERDLPHRKCYKKLEDGLYVRQILALTGLRRTGKSTIAKQLIGKLLGEAGASPINACYFLFDEAPNLRAETLDEVIRTYVEVIRKENVSNPRERVYIFLDELQYVDSWSSVIKRFYDLSQNYKFIITGSSSLFISKKVSESLAGRIFEYKIPPLDFEEYLYLQGIPHHRFFSLEEVINTPIIEIQAELATSSIKMLPLFSIYLQKGQFPELIQFREPQQIKKYLVDSVIKKVIYHDLPQLFNIENTDDLNTIFTTVARETGNLLEYQNLARETAISQSTIKRYISHLKEAFLVDIIYNYTKKHRQARRQLKKGYVASTNFTSILYGWEGAGVDFAPFIGHLAETYIYALLCFRYDNIFFWRKQEKEIDFLVDGPQGQLFVEVKYQNRISKKDIKWMIPHLSNNRNGVVITKDTTDQRQVGSGMIKLVPAWAVNT